MSDATARVVDGKSWSEFCDALKNAGNLILNDQPDDPLTRSRRMRRL